MNGEERPAWLTPVTLEDWPTRPVESPELHYRLPLRLGWSDHPQPFGTPSEQTHIYRGELPAEWLTVSFLPEADPQSYLGNWVEALIFMGGFPVPAMRDATQARLLDWQQEEGGEDLVTRLGADEIFLYQGMASLPGQPPDLARFYILLLRRGTWAWKICLAFSSACPPGSSEELVAANDHVRAGASLGYLELI